MAGFATRPSLAGHANRGATTNHELTSTPDHLMGADQRRYLNLLATMLLGGLWHGAGWTFVVWGALHGIYLIVNHGFRALRSRMGWQNRFGRAGEFAGAAITFLSVVIAWVFFRADSFAAASIMLHGMVGTAGFGLLHLSNFSQISAITLSGRTIVASIGIGLVVVWLLPNTQEFMRVFHPTYENVAQPKDLAAPCSRAYVFTQPRPKADIRPDQLLRYDKFIHPRRWAPLSS